MYFPLTYILKLPIFGCPLSNNEAGDPLFLLRIFTPHACLLLVKKSNQGHFIWIFLAQAACTLKAGCIDNYTRLAAWLVHVVLHCNIARA